MSGGGRRVYLAGPEVFLPDAAAVLARKAGIVRDAGLEPLVPVDEEAALRHHRDLAVGIHLGNRALLDACDLVIANLTPFRGSGADPGTVFELGYAAARGCPVHAYTADVRDLAGRIHGGVADGPVTRDPDGLLIEDFGRAENLMPAVACELAGLPVVRVAVEGSPAERIASVEGLRRVLELVAG